MERVAVNPELLGRTVVKMSGEHLQEDGGAMSNTVEGREATHGQEAPSVMTERAVCLNAPSVLHQRRAELGVLSAQFVRPAAASVTRNDEAAGQLKLDAAWCHGNSVVSGEQNQRCP